MHSQLSWPEADTPRGIAAAWSHLAVLASTVDSSLDKWLGDAFRIGLTEFRALGHLSRATDKELRVNDLAHQVGLTPSSITRLVSRLEAKGLVQRDVCVDDGRGVYAVITPTGEKLLHDAQPSYEAHLRDLLGELTQHFPHLSTEATSAALADIQAQLNT